MYLLAATTTDLGPVVGGEVAGADTGEAMETAEGGGRGGACCCGCGHTDRQTDRPFLCVLPCIEATHYGRSLNLPDILEELLVLLLQYFPGKEAV